MSTTSSGEKPRVVMGNKRRVVPSWAQLRYINDILTGKERLSIGVSVVLLITSLVFVGIYHYFATTELQPKQGGEYIEGVVGQPQYINPVLAQTNDVDLDISRLLFSSLFRRAGDQSLQNDLVSDYEISEDQLTYTFYLRRDAQWHDGQPVTADDVLFTISAIQDPNFQSPLEPSLRGVKTNRIDDYTFTIELKEPFAPFLSSLTFGILPRHIWANAYNGSIRNITLSEYNIKPIGSGPFKFKQLSKDPSGTLKSYQVEPFTGYYGEIPYIQKLTFMFYSDTFTAAEALRRKEIQGLSFITPEQRATIEEQHKQLDYYQLQLPQYTAIFFNQDKSAVLSDDAVRQALIWGVDRNTVIDKALGGEGRPLYTPILEGYIGHNSDVQKYGFDIEKGKEMLKEAGWTKEDKDEFRSKDGKTLEFSIATVNQPEFLATLEVLQEAWTKMGIKVNVNVYEPEDIQEQIIKPREYEALLFGQIIGADPDPYAFWHSTQMEHPGLALSVFYQKNIDDLLETARKTSDEEQRRLKYFHFQNILAEELPAIFLYTPYYTYAIHHDVQGVHPQYITTPADRFADVAKWYIENERVPKSEQ